MLYMASDCLMQVVLDLELSLKVNHSLHLHLPTLRLTSSKCALALLGSCRHALTTASISLQSLTPTI